MKPLEGVRATLIENAARDDANDRLRDACLQVEGLFIAHLLAAMDRPVFGAGVFGQSAAGRIFAAQRNRALAEIMGRRGELGLARMLEHQLADDNDVDSVVRE